MPRLSARRFGIGLFVAAFILPMYLLWQRNSPQKLLVEPIQHGHLRQGGGLNEVIDIKNLLNKEAKKPLVGAAPVVGEPWPKPRGIIMPPPVEIVDENNTSAIGEVGPNVKSRNMEIPEQSVISESSNVFSKSLPGMANKRKEEIQNGKEIMNLNKLQIQPPVDDESQIKPGEMDKTMNFKPIMAPNDKIPFALIEGMNEIDKEEIEKEESSEVFVSGKTETTKLPFKELANVKDLSVKEEEKLLVESGFLPFADANDTQDLSVEGEENLIGESGMLEKSSLLKKKRRKTKARKGKRRKIRNLSDKENAKPTGIETKLLPLANGRKHQKSQRVENERTNLLEKEEGNSTREPRITSGLNPMIRKNLSAEDIKKLSDKPWFMSGGKAMPTNLPPGDKSGLWPAQQLPGDDRITNQLLFRPPLVSENGGTNVKTILTSVAMLQNSNTKSGRAAFINCPVDNCHITTSNSESRTADAHIFREYFVHPGHEKPDKQVWIYYQLESPYKRRADYKDVFNWTATYRRDSDIVAPYEKYVHYNSSVRQLSKPTKNYAGNKTKKVAWFVSNCNTPNKRLEYARELQKYITVDIYGVCGNMRCPRYEEEKCFQLLNDYYKFYLSFENTNCKDYITEKFFVNALQNNVLPIVMGARPEDYKLSAPEHSYIHVDDFDSPQSLASYLHLLDNDDDLYNSYFKWKGTGEFINTHFWCRLCAMLHDNSKPNKWYEDLDKWWREPGTCTSGSWNKAEKLPQLRNNIPPPHD